MARYRQEVPQFARDRPYDATYKFDKHHDYMVSVSQGVVQDVFHLAEDAKEIRSKEVFCTFLRTCDKPDSVAPEFTVLIWHNITVCVDFTSQNPCSQLFDAIS